MKCQAMGCDFIWQAEFGAFLSDDGVGKCDDMIFKGLQIADIGRTLYCNTLINFPLSPAWA